MESGDIGGSVVPPAQSAGMTQTQASGPGMVSLDAFVEARLREEPPGQQGRADLEMVAKEQVLAAYRRSRFGTTHRAGLAVALKAFARIWADHGDFDPSWRS